MKQVTEIRLCWCHNSAFFPFQKWVLLYWSPYGKEALEMQVRTAYLTYCGVDDLGGFMASLGYSGFDRLAGRHNDAKNYWHLPESNWRHLRKTDVSLFSPYTFRSCVCEAKRRLTSWGDDFDKNCKEPHVWDWSKALFPAYYRVTYIDCIAELFLANLQFVYHVMQARACLFKSRTWLLSAPLLKASGEER